MNLFPPRCYHESLENKSFHDIAQIYSRFENPSCTRLELLHGDNYTESPLKCDRWIYEYDFGYRSMNTDLNWVCDSAYKARVGQSLFFIGSVVGTLFYGCLSDKIGRLPALILSNLCGFLGDFSTIFTRTATTFSLCRFISGLAADTNFFLMYIIVLEYIRPSMRTLGINLAVGLFYTLGLVFTPWLAVVVGNWKYYLAFTSIPILSVMLFYFVIQESAQWLVTRDNIDGAILRLKRVAKFNGKNVSNDDFNEFRKYCEKQKANAPDGENFGRGEKMFDFPCLTKAADDDDEEEGNCNSKDVEIAQLSRVASKVDATSNSEDSSELNANETSRL
uniref:Major facilitator superfamily (MFS) profile domain-containing protein n=1 Tax=Megaselia scalaris TaxID=36166 RepID=T1GM93_MEGSC